MGRGSFHCSRNGTAITEIKSEKAAGEDEIRAQMLKALTEEGILWLTRVCQVAWKFGKTPSDWQTGVIIPILRKETISNVQTTERYHSSVFQEKYVPNALKGKA